MGGYQCCAKGYCQKARLDSSRDIQTLAQGLSTVLDRVADVYRVGVAGGSGPLWRVAEDAIAAKPGEELYFSLICRGLDDS